MKYNLFLQRKILAMNRLVGLEEHYNPQTHILCYLTYNINKADKFREKLIKLVEDHGVIYAKNFLNDLSQFVENSENGWEEDVVIPMNKYFDSLGNPLPHELRTKIAIELLDKLVAEGYLDNKYQPIEMSGTERGLWAYHLSEKLNIKKNRWKVFGRLWGHKSETLRSYYSKAQDQRITLSRLDKIKHALT